MGKSFSDRLMDLVSNAYQSEKSFVVSGVDLNKAADFCLNRCPHPYAQCNGICCEYMEFAKRNKTTSYNKV